MEALQMLKYSLKKGRILSFTKGTDKESELRLMEELVNDQGSVPEDITEFIDSLYASDDDDDE